MEATAAVVQLPNKGLIHEESYLSTISSAALTIYQPASMASAPVSPVSRGA